MRQGTYHYVQRFVGEFETQPTEEHPEHIKQEVWVDVPYEDGTAWRSWHFATAVNHMEALNLQEPTEKHRIVKRTFHEEVIIPRWRYIEQLTSTDPEGQELWERCTYGEQGVMFWRSRTFTAALTEISARLEALGEETTTKFRIISPEGNVEGIFSHHDLVHPKVSDEGEDIADLDEEEIDDEEETCDECGESHEDLEKTQEL